jgi:hypothetical protein
MFFEKDKYSEYNYYFREIKYDYFLIFVFTKKIIKCARKIFRPFNQF